jgi:O-antigen/teichoic acid export membrane protein
MKLLNNIFLKNTLTLFSGSAIAQIIGIAFLPVLTRLFTPEEFGVFYVFVTTATILSIISTGSYETSLMLPESDKDARQLLTFSIMLSIGVTILYLLICLFLQQWGNVLFQTERSRLILWLIPVYSLLVGLTRIFQNWSIRSKRYNWVSTSNIIRSGSLSGMQSGFGLIQSGSFGLVAGSCLSLVFPLWFLVKKNRNREEKTTSSTLKQAIIRGKEYISFPRHLMPTDLLTEVSIQSPIYVLRILFTNAIVAIYTLPQKILNQPARFIGQAVSEVYYRQASELNSQNKDLAELSFSVFKNLFILGIVPFVVTIFWGREIFSFVFSSEWEASGRIAAILSPWLLFEFAASPVSNILIIRKKLKYLFSINLLLLIIRIACLLIGTLVMKSMEISVILFAGSSLLYWIYMAFFSLHLTGVPHRKILFFLCTVIVSAVLPLGLIKILLS